MAHIANAYEVDSGELDTVTTPADAYAVCKTPELIPLSAALIATVFPDTPTLVPACTGADHAYAPLPEHVKTFPVACAVAGNANVIHNQSKVCRDLRKNMLEMARLVCDQKSLRNIKKAANMYIKKWSRMFADTGSVFFFAERVRQHIFCQTARPPSARHAHIQQIVYPPAETIICQYGPSTQLILYGQKHTPRDI